VQTVRVEAGQSVSGGGPAIAAARVVGAEGLEPSTAQRAAPPKCRAERGIPADTGGEISAPAQVARTQPRACYDAHQAPSIRHPRPGIAACRVRYRRVDVTSERGRT
jgi:hypothetical protein